MTGVRSADIQKLLLDAGVEIYQTTESEIQVAERIRFHMMDSGVRVRWEPEIRVLVIARSQRSDFPSLSSDALFQKVRSSMGPLLQQRGYQENSVFLKSVTHPMDASKVLDLWHEVTFASPVLAASELAQEVKWAVAIDKYVSV